MFLLLRAVDASMARKQSCRVPGCEEEFESIGRLFYHESQHSVDLPQIDESVRLYSVKKATEARVVTLRRDRGECQFPTCNQCTASPEGDKEKKQIEVHHLRRSHHPDYMVTLCSTHHGLADRDSSPIRAQALIPGPITDFGPLEPNSDLL